MDINEQIILTIWNTINKVPLNKTYFVIGTPDQIEKSHKYSAAVSRFGITDDDYVFLIYDAGVLRTCIKGMAISLSGVYMRGFDPHHWYWPDFINMDIRCDGSKIYIGRDEEVGGTPDIEKFAACLVELQNKLRPLFFDTPNHAVAEEIRYTDADTSDKPTSLGEIVTYTFFDMLPDFNRFGNKVFGTTLKNGHVSCTYSEATEHQIHKNFLNHLEDRDDYDDNEPEGPLVAFDYSSNMSEGFVITERHFMWKFASGLHCINIEKIISATKKSYFLADCMVLNTSNSGPTEKLFLTGMKNSDEFIHWLNAFLKEVQKRIS